MKTPFGVVGVRTSGAAVTEIAYLAPSAAPLAPADALAERACRQIERYLDDPGFRWDLPLARAGTEFRRRVWRKIAAIPMGQVRPYGALAKELGSAARAVGQACGDNPFPLVIPCHRVVAASGLGGFAHRDGGYTVSVKRWLLAHEGVSVD
jgi:methylated-DNA-[protein]-cysteine S-methyltransferase